MGDEYKNITKNISSMHINIAKDVWPNGGIIECRVCEFKHLADVYELAGYLKSGWPVHCGRSMCLK